MEKSTFTRLIQEADDILEFEKFCFSAKENPLLLLRFPKNIEKHFRNFCFESDKYKNILFIIIGCFFYNIFAVMDKLMINDIYPLAWKLRFLVVTPMALSVILILKKTKKPFIMDSLLTFLLLTGIICIFFIVNISQSEFVSHYYVGVFVVCTAGILVYKISLQYKILFSLSAVFLHIPFFYFNQTIPFEVKINLFAVSVSLIIVSLLSAAERELNYKKAFVYGLIQEITKYSLKRKNKFLENLSNKDELTGLANRRFLKQHLKRLITQTGNGIFPIAVLFTDIDDFKKYNDGYGHAQGDECLKKVSEVLNSNANRKFDLAARVGGEEFILLFPFTDKKDASGIANKILKTIHHINIPHEYSKVAPHVTISIGVSFIDIDNQDIDLALNQADQALYQAKETGKNKACFYC